MTLMSGTIIAQSILIFVTPILTRIYSPYEFGLFALYISIYSVIATISTGKYEIAIMAPKSDLGAKNVMELSIIFALCISVATILPMYFFAEEF